MENNTLARSLPVYHILDHVLISSSKDITCGTITARLLLKLVLVHCHHNNSSGICGGHTGELNEIVNHDMDHDLQLWIITIALFKSDSVIEQKGSLSDVVETNTMTLGF